jgi:hypothetical protein
LLFLKAEVEQLSLAESAAGLPFQDLLVPMHVPHTASLLQGYCHDCCKRTCNSISQQHTHCSRGDTTAGRGQPSPAHITAASSCDCASVPAHRRAAAGYKLTSSCRMDRQQATAAAA